MHAAVKLNAAMELALRFRLERTEEPVEVAGRVAWLGPTQKEAGIAFSDLPSSAEPRIADWIAEQENPASDTQRDLEPQSKSSLTKSAAPPLPIRASAAESLVAQKSESVLPRSSMGIPHLGTSESSQLHNFLSTTPDLPETPPAIAFRTTEERFEKPSDKLLRSPAKRYEVLLEPEKPMPAAKEILPQETASPSLTPASSKVIEVSRAAPQAKANDSVALEVRRRRKLGLTVAACAAGIVVLMLTVMSRGKPADRNGSGEEAVQPVATAEVIVPESAVQIAPEAPTDQSVDTTTPADIPAEANYDLLPIRPTHEPLTVPQDGDWASQFESMLGMGVSRKLNPAVLGLPVWTVRHSGYYYCADNLNSTTPQPGALIPQGEALQSGYQPKLGKYCN